MELLSAGRADQDTQRWLPLAILATSFVVILPALAVWAIVPQGEAALLAISVPLGMLLSVLAASAGAALWKRTPGSRDMVFADLMLWGWLRRSRTERRLARAEALLGAHAKGLSVEALTELSAVLEARDRYTYGHSQRVTRHAERIARGMGLPDTEVAKVRTAAALHDVGKLHTPREILNKPGRLTEEEFDVIRRHPGDGADMASGLGDPVIVAMIRHHHERLDGKGYPAGLGGDAIPLGARIIAVADTFDAMTSNRAYRRATSHKRALDVLAKEAGTQLDGDAVACFLRYYRGRRTVAWSAFAIAAPQRFFAWLGGVVGGASAGAAGAAALLIGIGTPQAPVVSAAAPVAPRSSSTAAPDATPAAERDLAARGPRRFVRAEAGERATRGRSGTVAPRLRAVARAPRSTAPAAAPALTSTPSTPSTPSRPTAPRPPAVKPPVEVPKVPLPPVRVPEVELPAVELPQVNVPQVKLPQVELPSVEVRGVELPRVRIPPVELPEVRLP